MQGSRQWEDRLYLAKIKTKFDNLENVFNKEVKLKTFSNI